MNNATDTREAWLQRAVVALRARFERAGYPIPATVHVSVGFPSRGGLRGKRGVTVGQVPRIAWIEREANRYPE